MNNINMNRPTWQEYFKQLVELTATRSSCKKLHVGCILIKDNRIIAQGYNGHIPGYPHESITENGHEIATIHAEQNALIDCAKRGVSTMGCSAYITHYPCFNCIKLIISAGIKNIYYINDYNNDKNVEKICNYLNIDIIKI